MSRTAPTLVRGRRIVGGVGIIVLMTASLAACSMKAEDTEPPADPATRAMAEASRAASPPAARSRRAAQPQPSDRTALVRRQRITGQLSPKSLAASPTGLVTAQNMMYNHTVSVFTPGGRLKGTVDDSVDLSKFGIGGHPGTSRGAPVEAAFTHDGKHVYVSNYSMYGKGFGPEGLDTCTPATAPDKSFVYRINVATRRIDQVIPVGAVPKYVAVTPDDSRVLVTNWCSGTMSVINTRTATLAATIPLGGALPRGIAVTADSRTAFIALMGSHRIVRVDLATNRVSSFAHTGSGPRHIVISPDGRHLFVTNNNSGTVSKVDAGTGTVLKTVSTGRKPRSMAISSDGKAVYVVNYESSTVSKLRTSDLTQIARAGTDLHPIGIVYEPTTRSVWVACYGGSIIVFDDSRLVPREPDARVRSRVK